MTNEETLKELDDVITIYNITEKLQENCTTVFYNNEEE